MQTQELEICPKHNHIRLLQTFKFHGTHKYAGSNTTQRDADSKKYIQWFGRQVRENKSTDQCHLYGETCKSNSKVQSDCSKAELDILHHEIMSKYLTLSQQVQKKANQPQKETSPLTDQQSYKSRSQA